MNKDIRLDLSFSTHRKRKKLFNILGAQGVLSLIDLWLNTAQNRPKGILTGMDEADIALDAQWSGDAGEFCRTLCDVGFLERAENGTYSIHDWRDHQRYAYFAEEGSQRAREAVEVRWSKRDAEKLQKACGVNTERIQTVYGENTKGNTPSPSPSPKKTSLSPSRLTCPQTEIVDLYHKTLPELPVVKHWTEERRKNLQARWIEEVKRQSLDWWKNYFEYIRESPFLMGNGNKKWTPNLEWFVKKTNLVNVIEGKYHV
jgi:hypothetical protein